LIIVEGPDGAGKTTLCRWICKEFKLQPGPRSTTNRDDIYKTTRQDSWWALTDELKCERPSWVWDRMGPYSDPIYAAASLPHERTRAFTDEETEVFDVAVQHLGLVIVCLPPLGVVVENVKKERQIKGLVTTPGLVERIYDSYVPLADIYHSYDYTQQFPHTMMGIISTYLARRKVREELASSAR
jgi:hypothetical protein